MEISYLPTLAIKIIFQYENNTKIACSLIWSHVIQETELHLIQTLQLVTCVSYLYFMAFQGYEWRSVETELAYDLDLRLKTLSSSLFGKLYRM